MDSSSETLLTTCVYLDLHWAQNNGTASHNNRVYGVHLFRGYTAYTHCFGILGHDFGHCWGLKRPRKHKYPANHGFWNPPHVGPCNEHVGSLCLSGFEGPSGGPGRPASVGSAAAAEASVPELEAKLRFFEEVSLEFMGFSTAPFYTTNPARNPARFPLINLTYI